MEGEVEVRKEVVWWSGLIFERGRKSGKNGDGEGC